MKKKVLIALLMIVLSSSCCISFAKTVTNSELAEVIKLYKAGNYTLCYAKVDSAIKQDPANPLGYYYKAMAAAQIGRKSEAIDNYDRVLTLAHERGNLVRYARKGKRCLETPDQCHKPTFDDLNDEFIRGSSNKNFSDEAKSMFEQMRIEQMMRDMNRNDDISPQKFREYRDFSSMNTPADMPNNEEIVAAVQTLQKAGMLNFGTNSYNDLSVLTGGNNYSTLMGLMTPETMNSQLIQSMLMNNMSVGF